MNLFKILLFLHIAGGSISLLLGAYILLTRKGIRRHKLIGTVYFIAMLASALVALPMSYLHPNYFLFIIGVFTSYMLMSGKRYIAKKTSTDVTLFDWILMWVMLIFGLLFIIFGTYNLLKGVFFGIVFLVFGSISLLFVFQDRKNFTGKAAVKNFGLTTHLQRMVGSYIASSTAFLVVNNTLLPNIVAWLLPTLLFAPLISKWTKKYRIANQSKATVTTASPN